MNTHDQRKRFAALLAERLMARLTRAAEHDRLSEEFLRPSVGGSA